MGGQDAIGKCSRRPTAGGQCACGADIDRVAARVKCYDGVVN